MMGVQIEAKEEETMRKRTVMKSVLLVAAMGLMMTGCKSENESTEAPATTAATETVTTEEATMATTETPTATEVLTEAATEETNVIPEGSAPEGYELVWADEFDGTELSEADWNYEEHEVGWVNHELQEYIPSSEYAYIEDGKLVIHPVKNVDADGNVSYVSGRVNTQNKHDIKYGYIVARLKVPAGKGFLPAFWMMPKDEDYYGQWPKCGEIDIMEVLGNSTNMNYGTLHFGEPHKQQQGSYTLAEGDFASEYHTYAIEWYPGVIKWYVDGVQYFETSDWFSALDGEERAYPAPFNQPFHVILNVAVGGDWPGDPDPNLEFGESTNMYVDYVRMYRRRNYNEKVTKPIREMVWKEADATGNFITNGDFAEAEDLTDDTNWKFLQLNDGKGSAEIKDGEIIITTENFGTEEYSIQLVQPGMPMMNGKKYKFSFEAYADEDRQMKPAVTAPLADWIRYFPDTPVQLTKDWQTFEFEFEMTERDDDAGRIEFNMGNQGSTATIHIRNVRLEEVQ
jgi:beta-glucanase (GH16 family)